MSLVAIRCPHCELRQFVAEKCRRCRKSLSEVTEPKIERVEVERIVEKVVERVIDRTVAVYVPVTFPDASSLPTIGEMEKKLVLAAVKITDGDVLKASRMLGVGKTTVYRKLKEYGVAVRVADEVIESEVGR